jgi:hypothetical protein
MVPVDQPYPHFTHSPMTIRKRKKEEQNNPSRRPILLINFAFFQFKIKM